MVETIAFKLNGKALRLRAEPNRPLLWVLRTDLELSGIKFGCGQGHCGACTVLVEGRAVRACLWKLKDVKNKEVLTREGLAAQGPLHAAQKALLTQAAGSKGPRPKVKKPPKSRKV